MQTFWKVSSMTEEGEHGHIKISRERFEEVRDAKPSDYTWNLFMREMLAAWKAQNGGES